MYYFRLTMVLFSTIYLEMHQPFFFLFFRFRKSIILHSLKYKYPQSFLLHFLKQLFLTIFQLKNGSIGILKKNKWCSVDHSFRHTSNSADCSVVLTFLFRHKRTPCVCVLRDGRGPSLSHGHTCQQSKMWRSHFRKTCIHEKGRSPFSLRL